MPQIRPDAISNCIRLANEVAALVRSLIPERRTIDSRLPDACSLVDTGVDKESPNKKSIPCRCPQCDVFSWSNELLGSSSIFVLVTRVMSFIKFSASRVAVLCQPPQRSIVVFYDWIHIHNYAHDSRVVVVIGGIGVDVGIHCDRGERCASVDITDLDGEKIESIVIE